MEWMALLLFASVIVILLAGFPVAFTLGGKLAYQAYGFVTVSWSLHEASRESGGLPYPLIPMLKSILLLMPIAVSLQGVSLILRSIAVIRSG